MHSLTFEDVFPIVRDLARQKARTVIGRGGLTTVDREDIEAHLLSILYIRFPKFDPNRASVRTFASRVMDKELISIMRYRLAGRRRYALASRTLEVFDENADQIVISNGPQPLQRQEFWLDAQTALGVSCDVVFKTAVALCWHTPSELSRMSGKSRVTIYAQIRKLREAFSSAGIGPDYFSARRVSKS